ncbi:MAG TPA: hypothetical protein VGE72_01580 [Azospirillum sp.]
MGTRAKTTGQATGKTTASVRAWVRRTAGAGPLSAGGRHASAEPAEYRPEAVARIKTLAEAPSAAAPMTGDDFLKWLDT